MQHTHIPAHIRGWYPNYPTSLLPLAVREDTTALCDHLHPVVANHYPHAVLSHVDVGFDPTLTPPEAIQMAFCRHWQTWIPHTCRGATSYLMRLNPDFIPLAAGGYLKWLALIPSTDGGTRTAGMVRPVYFEASMPPTGRILHIGPQEVALASHLPEPLIPRQHLSGTRA